MNEKQAKSKHVVMKKHDKGEWYGKEIVYLGICYGRTSR